MVGCALDKAQRARLRALGGEAEVVAEDRAQPPTFVLRLILGCRGPDFASGMHSVGFGFHLLHGELAPC